MAGLDDYVSYLAFILVSIGGIAWFYVGITTASPDLLPVVPAILERIAYLFVGVASVLDILGIAGGYGLFSDDRSMMK
jgi:uncharacterized membrane protein YuzA (DUF378 family)